MRTDRPALPTSTAGSYARPSWLFAGLAAAERGELGPADVRELLDDAVDLAIREQEEAGIDIVTDGEMRRSGFFTASFYGSLTGLRELPPERRLGPAGHDQQHRFEVLEPIDAPAGLGLVAEFQYARGRTTRPLKVTIPGPFTMSGRLAVGPGQVYPDRLAAAEAFVAILGREVRALVDAGATYIQVDEPSPAIHPDAASGPNPVDFVALFNAALDGAARPGIRLAAHLCFGNYVGRPLARRAYRPVLDAMLGFDVHELVLEFANREMAELDVLAELTAAGRDVAVGVVDVKSYYLESPGDVAERIELVLEAGVPEAHLGLVPDCGFSQTARWASRAKLRALVAGRDLVLGLDRA
ncbi:MAG TPA: cobalamin-independent methionine synthase II family protein [Candidatus Limnocylindrales bacterium]